MPTVDLSIIIPAYNESRRLPGSLADIAAYVRQTGLSCELIVVDDGSIDGTADIVRQQPTSGVTLRVLANATNRGKGWAVRQGMLAASGGMRLMCDADLSTPIGELDKLRPWLAAGYDIAIASRDLPGADLDPPQPWPRRYLALLFRALRRRLLLPELLDTQCGFKLFRGAAAEALFGRQTLNGWLFDCEVLALAKQMGYRIREVPVRWGHRPGSRVQTWRTALTALPTLLRLRHRLTRPCGDNP